MALLRQVHQVIHLEPSFDETPAGEPHLIKQTCQSMTIPEPQVIRLLFRVPQVATLRHYLEKKLSGSGRERKALQGTGEGGRFVGSPAWGGRPEHKAQYAAP